jgi:hypothetical protein
MKVIVEDQEEADFITDGLMLICKDINRSGLDREVQEIYTAFLYKLRESIEVAQ